MIDFIKKEKTEMLERFPELASVQAESRSSQISVIEYTLKSSLNKERQKATLVLKMKSRDTYDSRVIESSVKSHWKYT